MPIPDLDDLFELITDSKLYGCLSEDGRLAAVGGLFLIGRCWRGAGPVITAYELAGLVVHPAFRRMKKYGLQDVLVAVRALELAVQEIRGVCLISSIAASNTASSRSMMRCGLQPIPEKQVPQWLLDVRRTWLAGKRPDVVDLILPPSSMDQLREVLEVALGTPTVRETDDGENESYQVELSPEIEADLFNMRTKRTDVAWEADVPPQRLLGKGTDLLAWPPL